MIGGVVFSILARLLALAEVEQLIGLDRRRLFQEIVSVGALLIAWDLFSTEFNYGVPQFPLILQPILIVFGAAMGCTMSLEPVDAAVGARWFEAMAWQGGGMILHPMVKVADGAYRSADPLPMYGKWKSMIRLHQGQRDLVATRVHAPEDAAIEKPAVQVSNGQTVEFISEQQVLRREERTDVPRWMWNGGYALLAAVGRGARGGRLRAAHLAAGEREREIA
jgi:hypothetical protein